MASTPKGLDNFLDSSFPEPAAEHAVAPPGLDQFIDEDVKQARFGTPIEQAKTAVEGLARGATLGASDIAETHLGISTPENIKGRMEANPATSALSQIGGGVGLIGLTGGAAAPIEEAMGGGMLARAVGTAAEGGLFGAGNSVSDSALGDSKLNAQKILTDIGMGAALGSGLGVLSKGVELALPAATKKLNSALGKLRESIAGTEENPSILVRAASVPGSMASGEAPADWAKAFQLGLKGETTEGGISSLTKNLQEIHSAAESAKSDLSEVTTAKNGAPISVRPLESFETATRDFQKSFMTKEGSGNLVVSPAKVSAFFKGYGSPGQELKAQHLNEFINQTQLLSKASENFHGFKAAEKSISEHVNELASKNEHLKEIAEALKSHLKGTDEEGLLHGALHKGVLAHVLGVPNPAIEAGLAALTAYKGLKNPYQLGKALGNFNDKLRAIGEISHGVSNKISNLSKSIFGAGATVPVGTPTISTFREHERRVARLDELSQNPQTMMDHLSKSTEAMYEAAPNISQSLHEAMITGLQFLSSKVPRPNNEMLLSHEWKPSQAQIAKFGRYYKAVDDPLSVLKEVKKGTLRNESLEALEAVHPELLSEMRQSVTESLDPKKARKLNYATKLSLARFLGEPLDTNMLPQVVAANQLALSGPSQSTQQMPKQPRSTLGGLKQLNFANRSATELNKTDDDS